MRTACEPLFLPAVSFAAGIFAFRTLQADRVSLAAGLAALVFFWIVASCFAQRLRWPAALSACLVAGALAASLHQPLPDPQMDADPEEVLLLSGCIAGPVAADAVQSRFVIELEPGARARVTLTTKPGEVLPPLQYGDRIEIEAKVRKPRNFRNPGAFDYAGYLRRDSVFWLASARGIERLHKLPGTCGAPWRRAIMDIRTTLAARIAALYTDDPYASRLMPALIVGDNSNLDRSWTADFRRTGTYHALVISGLHITLVAGAALFLMRFLSVPFSAMLLMGAALAWIYAGVADWQAPVVRSALGFTLFVIARWFFREGRILNVLAATALVLLAIDPAALYDPSFQLTFLSVAAIGALATPILKGTFGPYHAGVWAVNDPKRDLYAAPLVAQFRIEMRLLARTAIAVCRLPAYAAFGVVTWILLLSFWALEMIAISACVQLALLVPTIAYFHQVSVTGILANLTVVPSLSAAVPIGLVAAILDSRPIALPASWLLAFAHMTTSWWASIEPGVRVPDSPMVSSAVLLAAVSLLGVLLVYRARRLWILPCLAFVVAAALVLVTVPFAAEIQAGTLELTTLDVGQGDSLLIVFPDSRTLLIDGGGFPVFDKRLQTRLDIGEDVVSPYLWRRGLHRLDAIAVSHLHDDHAAGIPALIRNFRPREVWLGPAPENSLLLQSIREAAWQSGSRILRLKTGYEQTWGKAEVSVLGPSSDYQPGTAARNDDSLILLLRYGRHKFLLTGDAERNSEAGLLASGVLSEVDVLKTAHHGSKTSTSAEFLEAVRPLFALISVGEGNTYGHPSPGVVERLHGMGTRVLRTDESGLVQIRSDGQRLTISRPASEGDEGMATVFDKRF